LQEKDFLFEIGTEELPSSYIEPAVAQIKEIFGSRLEKEKLSYGAIEIYSTPRRLAIQIKELQGIQKEEMVEKIGPATKVAYLDDGSLSKAGVGFLNSIHASQEEAQIKKTDKGDYLFVQKLVKGVAVESILVDCCNNVLQSLRFPKSMKWGNHSVLFARPIQWIVVIWGTELLPLCYDGISSSRTTKGNRYLGIDTSIEISNPREYLSQLREIRVYADREERKEIIKNQIRELCQQNSVNLVEDEALLNTVTDLVESPTTVLAEFDEKYLTLPSQIITSTISSNQKYFSLQSKDGVLVNRFIFISNANPLHSDLIRIGNQKVVKARLDDAAFYYHEDTKYKLADYVPKLRSIVFQAQLGTVLEKTERIQDLISWLACELSLEERDKTEAVRAGYLSKADLITSMLGQKEFTKLQGYIGKYYALQSGESAAVAEGIMEHYYPRGMSDGLPKTLSGALAAVADKVDTVCGIMGIGLIPTGSNDPYALRRAANGVIQILAGRGWNISLEEMIAYSLSLYQRKNIDVSKRREEIVSYFRQRVLWLLQQSADYDVIDAVAVNSFDRVPESADKVRDIMRFRQRQDFISLVLGYKRIANILSGLNKGDFQVKVDPSLFVEDAERRLFESLQEIKAKVTALRMDYYKTMEVLVTLGPTIDGFFEHVLVNTEQELLRTNRIQLLYEVKEVFLTIADLNKIVTE